ncbi:MAG: YfhO family protein [Deltaproteobacteria bacterium]|nr:YfhO family protein [Deltaproteobacteria bacterium]
MSADLSEPGYLILSEINYPGWQVFVDDQKGTILTGNYLFRTVPLQAGSHMVRFEYRPAGFIWGLRISLGTLIFILLVLMIDALMGMKREKDYDDIE